MTYTPLKNALFYTIQECTKGFEKTQFQELSETEFNHTEAFEFSSEPLGAGLERLALRRHIPNLSKLSQKFLSDWSILPGTAKHLTDFAGGGSTSS
ncbi:hypothetical protein ACS3SW_11720 [Roseobacteraceae bacterium S113]